MSLKVENVAHAFGDVSVLRNASLHADAGEIVCLFGPSGCGKTTLFRIIAGLEQLQQGSVRIGGETVAGDGIHAPPEARKIGFVFQDYVLFPHLTVVENVAFGLNGPRKRDRARAELALVGLESLANAYPHQTSGGQQQRVALARAFAPKPNVMLLDEPFASIDAVARRKLRSEIRLLIKNRGVATVIVTHDPEEALALGDRIAVMDAGTVIEAATPKQLFDTPSTPQGAAIFPGAQTVDGEIEKGVLMTPFGECVIERSPGRKRVVAVDGAFTVIADGAGPLTVSDCRFHGESWRVQAVEPLQQRTVSGVSREPLSAGSSARLEIDAARLRIFDRA